MARPGPETKLVKKMRDAAKEKYGSRFVSIKYHGSAHSEAGVSDLLCCLDGVFIAVEVKAPDNYGGSVEKAVTKGPTLKQLGFGRRVQSAGGVFAVCASVEHFMEILFEVENGYEDIGYRF